MPPWIIAGTVPTDSVTLLQGTPTLKGTDFTLDGATTATARGTPALVATALVCAQVLGIPPPAVLLAGDCGRGAGSRKLYSHLVDHLPALCPRGLTFHYLLPDVDWQMRILAVIDNLENRPLLVADAGYMYAVKMSDCAPAFDLFTPDAGELAFLADEEAPHPFYTRGFLLANDSNPQSLIDRAVKNGGAAKALLVKGSTDHIVCDGKITDSVTIPSCEAMEAIGGTGDTITGLVTALLMAGYQMRRACLAAALANRFMAKAANPTPATQIHEIIAHLPKALEEALTSPFLSDYK